LSVRVPRAAFLAGLGAVLLAEPARASPQVSSGLTVGGTVEDVSGSPSGAFHLGGRSDVLFLRNRGSDMAVGPYLDFATASFRNLDLGGGAEWLLPVRDDLPLVLSAGAFTRTGEGHDWAAGLDGTLFFGSRSYNFHSVYGMAVGLFAQARWLPFSSPQTTDLIFGIQLDAEVLAMPSILILSAIK
jgi:hypothetical protein